MKEAALMKAARAILAPDAEEIDPPYILPADLPLELSGESIRARLCTFTDARGAEWAMRPDLTLPVAEIETQRRLSGAQDDRAYSYAARAFRLPASSSDPMEFTQVGREHFSSADGEDDDMILFGRVIEAARMCGVAPRSVMIGDLAIVPAFIDALDLPELTAARLKRAFRQEGGVRALLEAPVRALTPQARAILDADDPLAKLSAALEQQSTALIGSRSPDEILEGLAARRAEDEAGGIPQSVHGVLKALGELDCDARAAADLLDDLCQQHRLEGPRRAIGAFADRFESLENIEPEAGDVSRFRADFGRRFTYYDGFLFEVLAEGLTDRQPVAAGGRYDGLIAALSNGKVSAYALGGVVRPDRLLRAKAAS